MQFPVDLTFKRLSWRTSLLVTDASGRVLGHAPVLGSREGRFPIFAGPTEETPIYWIGADNPLAQWFANGQGDRIGDFGPDPKHAGKFIFVSGRPCYRFLDGSPWRTSLELLFPDLPILNAIPGAVLQPETLAVRCDNGEPVFKIVKRRLMFDNRYRLTPLALLADADLECLMLSAIVHSMQDLALFQQWRP